MRSIVLALAAIAAAASFGGTPAQAQQYPWCAYYPHQDVSNCGFVTLAQCQATVSGIGGYCMRNPAGAFGYEPVRPRRHRSYDGD